MEIKFKFEIGDVVVHKMAQMEYEVINATTTPSAREYMEKTARVLRPMMSIVVSRYVDQCYAGMQIHYGIRTLMQDGLHSDKVSEPELELYKKSHQ